MLDTCASRDMRETSPGDDPNAPAAADTLPYSILPIPPLTPPPMEPYEAIDAYRGLSDSAGVDAPESAPPGAAATGRLPDVAFALNRPEKILW